MKGKRLPKGTIYKSPTDGLWHAEIEYLGKRWKHNGTPFKSTAEVWLSKKRFAIAALIEDKKVLAEAFMPEAGEAAIVKHNSKSIHGVSGSVYEVPRRRKNGFIVYRYVAEVNYLGQKIRKECAEREECEKYLAHVREMLNPIIQEATECRDRVMREARAKVGEINTEEFSKVLSVFTTLHAKMKIQTRIPNADCYTYVLFNPLSGVYKIGHTKDPVRRLKSYCVPEFRIVLLATSNIEGRVHKDLYEKRLLGEWFQLAQEDLDMLQDRYGFEKVNIAP